MNGALITHHRKTPKNPASLTSRVEQYLRDHGPATSATMAGLLGTGKSNVTNAVSTLQKSNRAYTSGHIESGEAIYAAGPKPFTDEPGTINTSVAAPRQIIGVVDYTPEQWQAPRAGTTQQEMGIPSRGSTGLQPWRPPIYACVGTVRESANQGRD